METLEISSVYCFMTNRCNFNCSYCYEKNRTGDMTWDTAKQVMNYLVSQHKQGTRANEVADISFTFFGGEPLLNWSVIKKVLEYSVEFEKKNILFGFMILTNGSIWTQEIHNELLKWSKHLGKRLGMQISLDGCEVSHDTTRKLANGAGSFKQVVANVKKYQEIFPHLILRETLIPEKVDTWYDDYITLSSLGDTISFTPIGEGPWLSALDKAPGILTKIFDTYEEQQKIRPTLTFSLLNGNITSQFRESKGFRGCHAGKHLIGVTVEGDIYPCHRFLSYRYDFNYKLGDIWKGIDESNSKVQEMLNIHHKNLKCEMCKSYGCHRCYAANLFIMGNMELTPNNGYCEFVSLVQKIVNQRADKVFANSKYTLSPWNCYKSPDTERRAIQMEKGEKIFGEDTEDLIVQAMSKILHETLTVTNQNQTIISLLKCLIEKLDKQETKVS